MKIRKIEHFSFVLQNRKQCFFGSKALLHPEQSNASFKKKRCSMNHKCCEMNWD